MRSQIGIRTHFCQADRHVLADNVSNCRSFLTHLRLELLGLCALCRYLRVNVLLLSDEFVRVLFCLQEIVRTHTSTLRCATRLLFRCYLFLHTIDCLR